MPRRKLVEPAAPAQPVAGPYEGPIYQGSNDMPTRSTVAVNDTGAITSITIENNGPLGPTLPTADSLVQEYLKIKDYLAQQAKVFAEFCKPYRDQQTQLENQMLDMLNRLGGDGRQSIKTESGTFFRVTIVTPKISDREKYLDFVLDNWDSVGNGMLQLGTPKKEAIDAYSRENNGALPDGVETSVFVNLNVRRA